MRTRIAAILALHLALGWQSALADNLLDRFGTGRPTPPSTESLDAPTTQKRRILKPNEKVDLNTCLSSPTSCLCPPNTVRTEIREAKWGEGEHYSRMTCLPKGCPAGKIVRQVTSLEGTVSFRCASPGKWN